MNKFKQDFD